MVEPVSQTTGAIATVATESFTFKIGLSNLLLPLSWIPGLQKELLSFILQGNNVLLIVFKIIVLLLPVLLFLVGIWITSLSIYTILFRSKRINFLGTLVLAWWDVLTSIWSYWLGIIRLIFLSFGWLWELIRITIIAAVISLWELILLPFRGLSEMAKRYSQPGIPWIAVFITLLWCVIEATVFTFTLMPTMTEVLADITGVESPALIMPILWIMLFLLITGSFACLAVLIEAFTTKKIEQIIQMLIVEFFVMFVEVVFLYRELVDAITPWIAQQTGGQVKMGLISTLFFASFIWLGIRAMTWFLFAKFGTPTLLAVISRKKLEGEVPEIEKKEVIRQAWGEFIAGFKNNIEWFNTFGKNFLEAASLPIFQIIAAGINMIIVLVTAKLLFQLPFKTLDEVLATRELLKIVFKEK